MLRTLSIATLLIVGACASNSEPSSPPALSLVSSVADDVVLGADETQPLSVSDALLAVLEVDCQALDIRQGDSADHLSVEVSCSYLSPTDPSRLVTVHVAEPTLMDALTSAAARLPD